MQIGEKLKDLRLTLGLTQEELAERSEVTKGFISQIERDNSSPTIDTLSDILEALGTSLNEFFLDQPASIEVFKEEDYFEAIDEENKSTVYWIVPNTQKNDMEPIKLVLEPKGKSKVYTPFEGQEFIYVLKGKVEVVYKETKNILSKGECCYLKTDANRQIINKAKGRSEIIWVSSPPGF